MTRGSSGAAVAVFAPTGAMTRRRRSGAALLLVGGVLEALQYSGVLGALSSMVPMVPVDVFFTIPRIVEASGLVLLGLSMSRRARVALVVAGAWNLAGCVVEIVHDVSRSAGSRLSPPLFFFVVLGFLAVIVAAVVVFSDVAESRRTRSVLLLPALGLLALLSSGFLPLGPVPWLGEVFVFLPSAGFIVAGGLLLRRPEPSRDGQGVEEADR